MIKGYDQRWNARKPEANDVYVTFFAGDDVLVASDITSDGVLYVIDRMNRELSDDATAEDVKAFAAKLVTELPKHYDYHYVEATWRQAIIDATPARSWGGRFARQGHS